MELIWPSLERLSSYLEALKRGWSSDTIRTEEAAREQIAAIAGDPVKFVESLVDREARGGPIRLPDGSTVPRLPGYQRWMWDGEFCGSIHLRWQPGTPELPPTCLGHIGYTVVPWKRGRGYAKEALRQILPEARAEGLPWVQITVDPDNIASQKVILANGGVLTERFEKTSGYAGGETLRFRVALD